MERMTDDQKQAAIDAKRFLEDPTTPRVLDRVVSTYRKQLEESAHDDSELREHCYLMLKATRELHRQLTMLATKGTMEIVRNAKSRGGADSAA